MDYINQSIPCDTHPDLPARGMRVLDNGTVRFECYGCEVGSEAEVNIGICLFGPAPQDLQSHQA